MLNSSETEPIFSLSDALSRAVGQFQTGKLQEAASSCREILGVVPDNSVALQMLGIISYQSGKHQEAADLLGRAVSQNSASPHLYYNLGTVLSALDRTGEAIEAYRSAVTLDPRYADAYCLLGKALKTQGNPEEALAAYRKAAEIKPDSADAWIQIGELCQTKGEREAASRALAVADGLFVGQPGFPHRALGMLAVACGQTDLARKHFEICLRNDPQDEQGVYPLLAGIGFDKLPARVPELFLQRLYNMRASRWDQVAGNAYRGTGLIAEMLETLCSENEKLDILDAGCGTGLIGQAIAGRAKRLDGVDLSAPMLEQAKAKNIYTELHHNELVAFMTSRKQSYQAITCAATLIHFVDLQPAFAAAADALRDRGLFIFTVFPNEQADGAGQEDVAAAQSVDLARGGCFSHSREYICHTAEATGFVVEQIRREVHEYNNGVAQMCLVVALRRNKQ